MPGYRKPHTTAFAPGDLDGFNALEKAFQGRQWASLESDQDRQRELKRRTVPTAYADIPSSEESSLRSVSPGVAPKGMYAMQTQRIAAPAQEASVPPPLRRMPRKVSTPPHLTQESYGLPPTPPTMANSDDAEPRQPSHASGVHFADAVRNALHGQKPSLSRPLPTPDPSPPATNENLAAAPLHSLRLKPAPPGQLSRYPSSRGESFYTAREDPAASQINLARTPSPEPHFSSHDWLASSGGVGLTELGRRFSGERTATPKLQLRRRDLSNIGSQISSRSMTPTPLRRKQRPRSPYLAHRSRDDDFDKQMSYVSDEGFRKQTSVEDINDFIYKSIREENVKRHSAMSNGDAVPAGVYFDQQGHKTPKLRRARGAQDLRSTPGSDASQQRPQRQQQRLQQPRDESPSQPRLRHRGGQLPTRSLEASPEIKTNLEARRAVQDPVLDISMTETQRMTEDLHALHASKQEVDRSIASPKYQYRFKHTTLRHRPLELMFEAQDGERHASLDTDRSFLSSPSRKGSDAQALYPSTTPVSVNRSQVSVRSDMEVCEARGVSIFPHCNESLVVVQQGSRPGSKDVEMDYAASPDHHVSFTQDNTLAPAPTIHVDSRLTDPRQVPLPPFLQVIPPTPNDELDRQLALLEDPNSTTHSRTVPPSRRLSLAQRARRFSESYIETPLFGRALSLRKPLPYLDQHQEQEEIILRPTHLSPFWRPTDIWDGYDAEYAETGDEYYEEQDGEEGEEDEEEVYDRNNNNNNNNNIIYTSNSNPSAPRLPLGGDTSAHPPSLEESKAPRTFPRALSVRMPGFRGTGGFLLGNSLGLDRHGTNNRRPYVVKKKLSSGRLRRKQSRGSYVGELRTRTSEEVLRRWGARWGVKGWGWRRRR
ncbi:hypothetical protein B0A50_08287 [Salinomyces thailandicus]|uniref:Uncharacterized protein n=1 Tax=Salinomyces thailandicus TaxID=706561 RepID=A0A4U0TKZ7_9PEZI|nr:hypothetical protein B0A50_08287 [Salinomyces thailandica]